MPTVKSFASSPIIHGKGFIVPRELAPGPGGSFVMSKQSANGAEPKGNGDNTMIVLGVGLVLAAGAAWYFLR